jgi:peptidoglycan/LPS O-acetylase OafA/YrhL
LRGSGPDGVANTHVTLHSIQHLRGVAAVGVVYFHTKVYLADFAWPLGRQFGYGGVDLFFVISGVIMMMTTFDGRETPGSFYLKRILRVVPLYWAATLACVALFMIVPSTFLKQNGSVQHVLLSMLFVPHSSPGEAGAAPFLKIGWTLNFEMFFYFVFGLTLWMRDAKRRLAVIAVLFATLVTVGAILQPRNAALGYYTSPFVLEFLMGAVIGYLACNGALRKVRPGVAVLAAGMAAALALAFGGGQGDGFARTVIFGIPAAVIVAAAIICEQRGWRLRSSVLERLGDASYSVYLAHPFVLTAIRVGAKSLPFSPQNPLVGACTVVLAVVLSILTGYLVFRCFERPVLGAMKRVWPGRGVRTRQSNPHEQSAISSSSLAGYASTGDPYAGRSR